MIYTRLHEIPARLFFLILETGDVSLLNPNFDQVKNKEEQLETLKSIWADLEDEDQRISKNPESDKFLNLSKEIEVLKCRQQKVEISVNYLRIQDDEDLRIILQNEGYKPGELSEKELSRIERLNKDLNVNIQKLETQLPKPKTDKKEISFDEIVVGYGIVVGQSFRPNEITQSEFRALENSVKSKIESISNHGAKR